MSADAVTYYVGQREPSVRVVDLADLHEVLDLVHTLIMDAPAIDEADKTKACRKVEEVLNWLGDAYNVG
jgi:hypothetical protein